MIPLQLADPTSVGEILLVLVVPVLVVGLGTYFGVLVALQSFFGASSWEEAVEDVGD